MQDSQREQSLGRAIELLNNIQLALKSLHQLDREKKVD